MDSELLKIAEQIKAAARSGDVILTEGRTSWWEFWLKIAYKRIQWYQRRKFGRWARWRDTHCEMWFSAKYIFSIQAPHAIFKPIGDLIHARPKSISLWRYAGPGIITPSDAQYMQRIAKRIFVDDADAGKYDYGQLVNIALNELFGADGYHIKWFDLSSKRKVCSVGVAFLFDYLRRKGGGSIIRLFTWPDGRRTDIERTMPAHFANSSIIDETFRLIGEWRI